MMSNETNKSILTTKYLGTRKESNDMTIHHKDNLVNIRIYLYLETAYGRDGLMTFLKTLYVIATLS
jgi:hypothetical protein